MAAFGERDHATSWYRTRGGRRFALEFALIVAVKIVLLAALWFAFFSHPRPDTAPAAIERHLLGPSAETPHDR